MKTRKQLLEQLQTTRDALRELTVAAHNAIVDPHDFDIEACRKAIQNSELLLTDETWDEYRKRHQKELDTCIAQHLKMEASFAYNKRDREAKEFCRLYNEALDKIVKLETELGRDPGDY